MRPYFEKMPSFGKALKENRIARTQESRAKLEAVEAEIAAAKKAAEEVGIPTAKINERGGLTVYQRLEYLVDPGTWQPLHSLYNPADNEEGTTNVVDGLGKIAGRWAVIIGFDNKVLAGAWIAGQPDNILRVTNLAKRLHIPLVWLVNCSGVKLPDQEKFYADRRGSRRALLPPRRAGAGGHPGACRHLRHQSGGRRLPGDQPDHPDRAQGREHRGRRRRHRFRHGTAGRLRRRRAGAADRGDAQHERQAAGQRLHPLRRDRLFHPRVRRGKRRARRHQGIHAHDPGLRPEVLPRGRAGRAELPASDLYHLLPFNQKSDYSFDDILARLVDGSEHMEFRPGYGPEVYTGLVKIDGMLIGAIGNRQGLLPKGYPEYADYPGIGGKLYRQGLIKMNEFVTLCARDRVPVIWFQDTTGIDVGDIAEKAELLGIGQSLVYSIQNADVPMMLVVLRKGSAAAHYIMGGPTANRQNAFTLGTAATEIYVMHGETAAVATYARRAIKDKDSGKPLEPLAQKMNEMAQKYYDTSRPAYCARYGFVDEIVNLSALRGYLKAFAGAVYQNPKSICPRHQMLLPRIIRG